jgi:multidrug efflux system outer membrane protein
MRRELAAIIAVLSLLLYGLMLNGCVSLAPAYRRPDAPVPAHWPGGPAYIPATATPNAGQSARVAERSVIDIPWQEFILDSRLRRVIEQALADSRDLREQAAAVMSARAKYRVQHAALLPTVDVGVSGSKSRELISTDSSNPTGIASMYSATVGLSAYEIDLFGRLRSLSNAALESYLETEATARAARISLITETAIAWLTLAADRSLLQIAQQTAQSAQRSMTLNQSRLERGVASAVDVYQAETVYQQARADAANYTTLIAQDSNALDLLVGSPVADELLPDNLPAEEGWLADVPSGISSQVLLQRPDVLAAEHQLRSANANIGAARAAFLPSLTLTTDGGLASSDLATLFKHAATVWSVVPSLSVPIFDGGANRANLDYSKSQKMYYIAAYEASIQTAFKEVANALARRGTMAEQLLAARALVVAAGESYRLSNARYEKGVDTYLNALDSQRTLYSAQSSLVSDRLTDLTNRVTLYKALGGGAAGTAVTGGLTITF